ncbi:MAG: hypothetical protein K6E50_00745 [Lachnospiraceae bacterium]|nr:hypothetical protein [Lachnospiraceae bacterium]
MKFKKSITALALSAIMMASQVMPALAAPVTGTDAAGNVLAYSKDTVTVPTTIVVAFNPQGYKITQRTGDTTGTTSQIASLNYGLESQATMDRIAKITFETSYVANASGEKDIEFVSTEEEATSAGKDEMKVYLAVASNTAAISKDKAATPTTFAVASGKSNVTGALLSDVDMTADTTQNVAFVSENGATKATISLSLNKAEYQVKSGETVDWTTTQSQLAEKMELKTLGGIEGFTFVGAMNTDADWTKAKATGIKITPTYDITEADGTEKVLAGTHAQVALETGAKVAFTSAGVITVSGLTAEQNYKSSKLTIEGKDYALDGDKNIAWGTSEWNAETGGTMVITMKPAYTEFASGKATTVTVTFTDDTTKSKTVTID